MTIFSPQILVLARNPPVAAAGVNFDFTGASLPGDITFTRSSSGTRFNSSGVLVTETTDVARFDYNASSLAIKGLLYEPARTNSSTWSEDITQGSTAIASTATINTAGAPDGTATFNKIIANSGVALHGYLKTRVAACNIPWTFSLYVKKAELQYLQIFLDDGNVNGAHVNIDLNTLTAVSAPVTRGTASSYSVSVEAISSTIARVNLTGTPASTLTTPDVRWGALPVDTSGAAWAPSSTGDGSSGYLVWGWDLDQASTASSYIKTTTASVTRAADNAAFTIPAGVATLRYTFDDDTTQDVAVSPGAYTIPTNLNRSWIKTIVSV